MAQSVEDLRSEFYLYVNATYPGLNIENEYRYPVCGGLRSIVRRLKALRSIMRIHEVHYLWFRNGVIHR